mmetsp:Transcript_51257/g.154001  ORF Transcript_51257/g.154001 Transcript_51257/m.154001 type:complete len:233 (+) Transcript_51257:1412-2110(+)
MPSKGTSEGPILRGSSLCSANLTTELPSFRNAAPSCISITSPFFFWGDRSEVAASSATERRFFLDFWEGDFLEGDNLEITASLSSSLPAVERCFIFDVLAGDSLDRTTSSSSSSSSSALESRFFFDFFAFFSAFFLDPCDRCLTAVLDFFAGFSFEDSRRFLPFALPRLPSVDNGDEAADWSVTTSSSVCCAMTPAAESSVAPSPDSGLKGAKAFFGSIDMIWWYFSKRSAS